MRHGTNKYETGKDAVGLTSSQASILLEKHGYNEVRSERKNRYIQFLKKFYGPVQLLLWFVALLSFFMKRVDDFYIIIALLAFNAVVGFLEERKADRAVEFLKSMLAPTARVLRDGKWGSVEVRLLVPGDIIRVRFGDVVPADAKVLESEVLEADESVISGESFPVDKKAGDLIYQGSTVSRGEATCVVTSTGLDTRYGITTKLLEIAGPTSHLEDVIMRIVKYLVIGDGIIVAFMFAYGTFALDMPPLSLIPFLLIIFVASVPIALSAAFTVSMALGIEKLAKKSVLVTRLEAVEDMATMTVLCTDKTGTLTQNAITVKEIIPYGYSKELVLKYAAEASRQEDNDPIDTAVLNYSSTKHIKTGKQVLFSPFTASTKMTEARIGDGGYTVVKGATWVIMDLVRISPNARKKVNADIDRLSSIGLRSIAVAMRKGSGRWTFAGIVALYDPPRPEVKKLIEELGSLGISIKMITGDSPTVAKEIANEIGLGRNIITLSRKSGDTGRIIKADGFAAVYPEDKFTIVKVLQKRGFVVGMTGDGVNDAPALKEAEVGIAVANATDVAKSAAAFVLTKNGLGVIVDAVKESRRIFERMTTYTMVKIVKVFQIVGFVALSFVILKIEAITPFMLILLMFTNDIVNVSLSTDNVYYSGKPDSWNIKSMIYSAGILGLLLGVESLIFIPIGLWYLGLTILQFQTLVFLMLNVTDKLTVFNLREKRQFWKSRPSNTLVTASVMGIVAGIILAYFGILIPSISPAAIIVVFALSVPFMLINDMVKLTVFKHFRIVAIQ